jgi:hypothetical protein
LEQRDKGREEHLKSNQLYPEGYTIDFLHGHQICMVIKSIKNKKDYRSNPVADGIRGKSLFGRIESCISPMSALNCYG